MEMIITKHMVRPSFPTPHKFKTHKLSSLDQVMHSLHIPLIFFYDSDQSKPHEEIARRLKQSLSEILTVFYPLAGTINGNSFVDCDDSGVEMTEARVQAPLSQFTQNPKMEELTPLLPTDDTSSRNDNTIMSVKVSFFDCGGIAIGVCLSHKVADAASLVSFMNAWAATCRGEGSRIIRPAFDLADHFPPTDNQKPIDVASGKDKIATKRFVFDGEKLEKLRKEASFSSGGAKGPTKVEAVSGFMWRSFIKAYTTCKLPSAKGTTSFVATHMVNLRPRAVPPLPEHKFGNCVANDLAIVSSDDENSANIGTLVSKLRASIKIIDSNYINNVIKGEKTLKTLNQTHDPFIKTEFCPFSSWRFPVYKADFGWGKPVWVCCGVMHFINLVILMDTPFGDGIEAWVNLPQDHHFFQIFQANYDNLLT